MIDPPKRSEDELLRRIAARDVFAFDSIVKENTATIYKLAFRLLLDSHEAEDACQEVFAKLWTCAGQANGPAENLLGWLRTVCTRICLNKLRLRRPLLVEELPEQIDEAPLADELLEREAETKRLALCFENLTSPQRVAIVLTYFEELPNKDAADQMGVSLKAFESTLGRARRSLAGLLKAASEQEARLEGAAR